MFRSLAFDDELQRALFRNCSTSFLVTHSSSLVLIHITLSRIPSQSRSVILFSFTCCKALPPRKTSYTIQRQTPFLNEHLQQPTSSLSPHQSKESSLAPCLSLFNRTPAFGFHTSDCQHAESPILVLLGSKAAMDVSWTLTPKGTKKSHRLCFPCMACSFRCVVGAERRYFGPWIRVICGSSSGHPLP